MKRFLTLFFIFFSFVLPVFAASFEGEIGKVAKDPVKQCPALRGKSIAVPLFPDEEGEYTCLGKFLAEILTNKFTGLGKRYHFQVKERPQIRQLELDLDLTHPEHDIDRFFTNLQTDFILIGSYLFPDNGKIKIITRILTKDGKVCAGVTKTFKIPKKIRALSGRLLFSSFSEKIIALGEGKRENRLKIYKVLKNGKKLILSALKPYVYIGERVILEIEMPFSGYVYLLNFNAREAVILYPLVGIPQRPFLPGRYRFPDVVFPLIKEFKVEPPPGRAVFEAIFVKKKEKILETMKASGPFYRLTAKECHDLHKKLLALPKEAVYIETFELFIKKDRVDK